MVLDIAEPDLSIYIAGSNSGWGKNEKYRYKYNKDSQNYCLYDLKNEDIGLYFKHFVICDKYQIDKIRLILNNKYQVTGLGDIEPESGLWRIWFSLMDYPVASGNNKWNS